MTLETYTRPTTSRFSTDWLLDPAEIANRVGGTDFVPDGLRNNPAAITAALLFGDEIGLKPMTSLAHIAVIQGRPTLSAEAQRSLILHAGHDLWIEELNTTRCTVAGRRRDSDEISRITWTMDDARRARLDGKQNWRMYPRAMLLARASAELARAVFPDAIAGLAATEELQDEPDTTTTNGSPPPEPTGTTRRRPRRASVTSGPGDVSSEAPSLESGGAGAVAAPRPAAAPASAPAPNEGAETEPLITDALRRQMFALMREVGLKTDDRDERLAYTRRVVGRDVASSSELTMTEARTLIDQLHSDRELIRANEQATIAEVKERFDATELDTPAEPAEPASDPQDDAGGQTDEIPF